MLGIPITYPMRLEPGIRHNRRRSAVSVCNNIPLLGEIRVCSREIVVSNKQLSLIAERAAYPAGGSIVDFCFEQMIWICGTAPLGAAAASWCEASGRMRTALQSNEFTCDVGK